MKLKPSKKLGQLMRELDERNEPRVAAALFRATPKLPSVRIRKVLVTTDFSETSMAGVMYARSFADLIGADLSLVHVVEPVPPMAEMYNVLLTQSNADALRLAQNQAARLARKLSGRNRKVTSVVLSGKPFHEIATLAEKRAVDVVVIGTHGHTGWERVLMGSTAERVVRHAPCPVLTVPFGASKGRKRAKPGFPLKKILVPIDFSETSAQALPYAAALAERFGAKLVLLHVIEPVTMSPVFWDFQPPVADADQAAEVAITTRLSQLGKELLPEDVQARTLVCDGVAHEEIAETARNLGVDLIVLSTHGHTGLKHVLLGSTAERVVRHARCPVLVVRQPASRSQRRRLKR